MKKLISAALPALAIFAVAGFAAAPAEAKIRCKGPYQIVKGVGAISTPYCGDNYLASIARAYGMRVSNAAIRNNPNAKKDACRLVGHDIRVQDLCDPYRYRSRRTF